MSEIGRLAMRIEGEWWVAYYAKPDTMQDAIELARIRMHLVAEDKRRTGFLAFMREVTGDMIFQATGKRVGWPDPPEPAPANERAGRG